MASFKAFVKHFGCTLVDWNICWDDGIPSDAKFLCPGLCGEEDYDIVEEELNELGSFNPETLKGPGDCKLTGVCFDEVLKDAFRKAWENGERDFNELMQAAFGEWLEDCQKDFEHQKSMEAFEETVEANEMEFLETGEEYNGANIGLEDVKSTLEGKACDTTTPI